MYDVGFISWEELEGAKAENIEINPAPGMNGDYAATYAADCAIRQFMELDGFTFQYHFETDEELEAYQAAYQEEYEAMRRNCTAVDTGYIPPSKKMPSRESRRLWTSSLRIRGRMKAPICRRQWSCLMRKVR